MTDDIQVQSQLGIVSTPGLLKSGLFEASQSSSQRWAFSFEVKRWSANACPDSAIGGGNLEGDKSGGKPPRKLRAPSRAP
ncbi:hypothetical protein TNIN_287291 [Trichonephila inaurata madagascariensis]|uniref:Uncharacterized protein n=1 Tax=Trichonephila inaurata madagascariensis TaxID=2747483 RepID=A0A8X6YLE6_9ARAC|nr:hypothetical protein TNIN_287291 [Trichonephila inaurata madagascariensis]